MTIALRPNWRHNVGPGSMPMPDDGTRPDLSGPYPQIHEDSKDCINEDPANPGHDGDAGPENVGEGGGTGIVWGYSVEDPGNVVRLDAATHKRANWYNAEHFVRQFRYALARADMTRDLQALRRVLEYANHHKQTLEGTGYSDDPGWIPGTWAQWWHQAQQHPGAALPGAGIPGGSFNARVAGEAMFLEAAALKVNPTRSPAYARQMLDTLALAAIPGTGQIIRDANTGGGQLDSVDVQHIDHWGIAAQGALVICRRLALSAPRWVLDGMMSLQAQSAVDYGGSPSPVCFQHTVGGKLVAATGPGQQAAPAHGWYSSNCAVLARLTGDPAWIARGEKFGPLPSDPRAHTDEQVRKETMLMRGLLAA